MQINPEIQKLLQRLTEGNKRFYSSKMIHPNQDLQRRQELTNGQKPFAIIIGCSDSRISPEVIFDQGLGDLFVIRVAGNIIDDVALGSIEYAAEHLETHLIMVLGHSKCGAVTATVQGGHMSGHIVSIADAIKPSIDKAKNLSGDLTDNTIKMNARSVAEQIQASQPILAEMFGQGRIAVVSAYYDVDTGEVTLL
ncbi:MAG TPA: carbonic anhydrase [Syntrophorhabdaceae bacterium]|nr:carbonic anhydrase [Syntrophorhabdaceae bacterium]